MPGSIEKPARGRIVRVSWGIIIVEIHSGGVEPAARADAVAGAMDEMLTEAFLRDAIPRQPIELPTLDPLSALPSVREMPNDGITC